MMLGLATMPQYASQIGLEQGEDQVQKANIALDAYRDIGMEGYIPYLLALMANIHSAAGQNEAALHSLDEALEVSERRHETWNDAEIFRLRGEIVLLSDGDSVALKKEAESYFQKALEIARQQSTRSWELRTSTSLAHLWWQQGKQDEAQQLLSGIYNWFTEGFDTKDLKEAKALLEELS